MGRWAMREIEDVRGVCVIERQWEPKGERRGAMRQP